MILPTKHISMAESILGLAGYISSNVAKHPMSMENIWNQYSKVNDTDAFPAYHNFNDVILAVDLLYSMGAIDMNERKEVYCL